MNRFLLRLYLFTALLHVPLVMALWSHAAWWSLVALVLPMLLFRGRVQLLRWDNHISAPRRLLLEEPYFVHWCALVGALFLFLPALLIMWPGWGSAYLIAYGGAIGMAIWGVFVRRRWVRVRHIDVDVPGLPAAFDGYRMAQMSDLHVGSMNPRTTVERWVRRVNKLDVDMVALTGDYCTSGVRFHEDIALGLADLSARDGVFAVMGNHDYFGEGEPLMSLLAEHGIRLLRNEHVELMRDDDRLCVAGVDDIYTKRIDIDAALAGRDDKLPLVVLAHDPRSFPKLAARGADLVLSGHTHWGQIALPLFPRINYASMVMRYHQGLYREGSATLYVNPGLGTTGPPVRFGTWPEITLIKLRAAVC